GEEHAVGLERKALAREAAPAHQSERNEEEERDPDQAGQEQQRRQAGPGKSRAADEHFGRRLGKRRHRPSPSAASFREPAAGSTRAAADFHLKNTCRPGSMPAPCSRATLTFSSSSPTATSSLKVSP